MSRSRAWCFTLNNWTQEELDKILTIECRYLVIGKEKGDINGTNHLQGYIYLQNAIGFKSIKEKLKRCHIEKAIANAHKNRVYCTKDKDFIEKGTIPEQGKRRDLHNLRNAICIEKKSNWDIIWDDELLPTYARHLNFVRDLRFEQGFYDTEKDRDMFTTVLYGPAGTGKTRYVYDRYSKREVYTLTNKSKTIWFNGYRGQKVLLIDDFYGWIKYSFLIKLLDRYQLEIEVKGSTTWAGWDKVFITSNKEPERWYPNKGLTDALERRIHKIIHMTDTEVEGNTIPPLQENETNETN